MKKILHFSVVLKWYDGSTFVIILTHQIITFNVFEDIRWCLQCLMLFGDVMGCLSESFGVSGWYFRILTIFWESSGFSPGLSRAEANPPFYHNSEMQDFLHLIILRHQNTKSAA